MMILVELDGAARWFGAGHTRVTALHPTSLTVEAGEFFALLGPSGSGKSTLLGTVAGFVPPSQGRVLVGDVDVMPVRYMVLDRVTPAAFDYAFYPSDLYYADLAKSDGAFDCWADAVRYYYDAEHLADLKPDAEWYPPSIFFQGMKFMLFGDPTLPLAVLTNDRSKP